MKLGEAALHLLHRREVGEDPQAGEGGEEIDVALRDRVLPPRTRERG